MLRKIRQNERSEYTINFEFSLSHARREKESRAENFLRETLTLTSRWIGWLTLSGLPLLAFPFPPPKHFIHGIPRAFPRLGLLFVIPSSLSLLFVFAILSPSVFLLCLRLPELFTRLLETPSCSVHHAITTGRFSIPEELARPQTFPDTSHTNSWRNEKSRNRKSMCPRLLRISWYLDGCFYKRCFWFSFMSYNADNFFNKDIYIYIAEILEIVLAQVARIFPLSELRGDNTFADAIYISSAKWIFTLRNTFEFFCEHYFSAHGYSLYIFAAGRKTFGPNKRARVRLRGRSSGTFMKNWISFQTSVVSFNSASYFKRSATSGTS